MILLALPYCAAIRNASDIRARAGEVGKADSGSSFQDSVVESRAREVSRESQIIARAWKGELARNVVVTVEQVLDGSALSRWWPA